MKCKTCKWHDGRLCRVSPPTPTGNHSAAYWPVVDDDDWCGAYVDIGHRASEHVLDAFTYAAGPDAEREDKRVD